jgi:hypothetical protein
MLDNDDFERRQMEHFQELQREDEQRKEMANLGRAPRCPHCGSHRYIEATKSESCEDRGASQSYW